MSFTWTNPVRMQRVVLQRQTIGNEVYDLILGYLNPDNDLDHQYSKKDLLNTALVCKMFSSIVIPWLYRDLYLSDESPMFPLCDSLLKQKKLMFPVAQYVKCVVLGDIYTECGLTYEKMKRPMAFFTTLHIMPNLTKLILSKITVTRAIIDAVSSVLHLQSLSVGEGCIMRSTTPSKILDKFLALRLEELEILPTSMDYLLKHFYVFDLKRLTASHVNLVDLGHYRRGNVIPYNLSKLERLCILRHYYTSHNNNMFGVLYDLKSLQEIHIEASHDKRHEYNTNVTYWIKEPYRLPKLKCITVPSRSDDLLKILLEGNNAEEVTIKEDHKAVCARYDEHIIGSVLRKLTEDIRILELPVKTYRRINSNISRFSNLQSLTITELNSKDYETNPVHSIFGKPFQPMSNVRTLYLRNQTQLTCITAENHKLADLKWHREMLQSARVYFPSLTSFSLIAEVEWFKDDNGAWRPFVPFRFRGNLKKALLGELKWVDYDNCFGRIVASA